jgi:osmotically-inducible protein OsmY
MEIKNLPKTILAIIVLINFSGCASRPSAFAKSLLNTDRRSMSVVKTDQHTTAKVISLLASAHSLWNKSHISAISYNKSLLLIGQTSSSSNIKIIENMVNTLPEVNTVYNQIKVKEPISFKVRAKDTWITTQVKAKLLSEPNIGPNRIKVYTEDSVVYLVGILNEREETLATNVANSVTGVSEVIKVLDKLMPT